MSTRERITAGPAHVGRRIATGDPAKPGVFTTEFWTMIVLQVLLTLNNYGLWAFVPARYAVFAQAALGSAYALSRAWAKYGLAGAGFARQVAGELDVAEKQVGATTKRPGRFDR